MYPSWGPIGAQYGRLDPWRGSVAVAAAGRLRRGRRRGIRRLPQAAVHRQAVAVGVARLLVADVAVERVAVERHLRRAVGALDLGHLQPGRRTRRRPVGGTRAGAVALVGRVLAEGVERGPARGGGVAVR